MASHVSICMSMEKFITREGNQFVEEEKNKRKGRKKKREKEKKGREKEGGKEIGVSTVGTRLTKK